ncbi:hypothetical protein CDAR_617551 [Caerostris darwini]|uniref:Uncharacterized protein n=1 Tax=Caerostris darwini TaxID=1538125 RepID=A0AAV4VQY4_9ARAC|nr:hypothetical protein CDAR_617551 [Caerostris darwini]
MSASYQTAVKPFKSSTLFGGTQSEDVGALERAPSTPPVKAKIKEVLVGGYRTMYSDESSMGLCVSIKPVVLSLLWNYVFSSDQWFSVFYGTMCFHQNSGSPSSMGLRVWFGVLSLLCDCVFTPSLPPLGGT